MKQKTHKGVIEYHPDQNLDDEERSGCETLRESLASLNDQKFRVLEFRNTMQTDAEPKYKIQTLFDETRTKWSGVFPEGSAFELSVSRLSVCISSLQDVQLFNSNLIAVDEAFEYPVDKSAVGEKGQYLIPRHAIDMCVQMLNPK